MGFQEDLQRLFAYALAQHDGNQAETARALDVNAVTFFGWIKKSRKQGEALYRAIDNAGGRLLVPGDEAPQAQDARMVEEMERLKLHVEYLKRENALLQKLVGRYEHEHETQRKDAAKKN